MRPCIKCGVLLDESNWGTSKQKTYTYICRDCTNKNQRLQRQLKPRDKDKRNAYEKELRLKNPEFRLRQSENRQRWWTLLTKEEQLEYSRKDRRKRIERNPLYHREKNLRQYGLTIEAYETICDAQCDKCLVCQSIFKRGKLLVDHDHETGKVRGLLCKGCNFLVGTVECRGALIEKTVEYLSRFTNRKA